jgi:bifunctional oligoribonuclease and PAP phosphatase NrnA
MGIKETKELILQKIKEYPTIIIVRHQRPDGDCLGSAIGLREMLRASFPEKKIYAVGNDRADYLDFIGKEDAPLDEKVYEEALIIIVDTATEKRIDDIHYVKAKEWIKIDHHINVEEYGHINYVREDLPACASIIMDFYDTFKEELTMPMNAAKALFTGIVTDTGRFKYSGVNGRVLELTGRLIDLGLNVEEIYTQLYVKEEASFKLQGYILQSFKTTPNGVAYMFFTKRIQKKFGVSSSEAAALVNALDSIRGKLIWIAFVEQDDGTIRARLRSRFVGIVELAQQYRGGGHKQASGATVLHRKELKELVRKADLLLGQFKKGNPEVF